MQNYPTYIQPPPPPKQGFWQRKSKKAKIGIIGICLLIPLSLCICISMASTPSKSNTIAAQTTATPISPTPTKIPVAALAEPTKAPTKVIPTPVPPTATPLPPTPIPTAVPTSPPEPTPTSPPASTGVNDNPWGYDFNPGNRIYTPDPAFCTVFACVTTFWKSTNGYVVECVNQEYSHSGGVSGACSRDGGVNATLYSH